MSYFYCITIVYTLCTFPFNSSFTKYTSEREREGEREREREAVLNLFCIQGNLRLEQGHETIWHDLRRDGM